MSDEAPSKREQRQAEALARALAGEPDAGPAPPEALEAAGLLVQSRDDPLPAERQQAVYRRVEAALDAPAAAAAGRRRRWWLPGTLAATAAAAAALALVLWLPLEPSPTGLPRPDSALLRQQARAAAGEPAAARSLARHMRAYRRAVLAELGERYSPAAAPAAAAAKAGRTAPAARSVHPLPPAGRSARTPRRAAASRQCRRAARLAPSAVARAVRFNGRPPGRWPGPAARGTIMTVRLRWTLPLLLLGLALAAGCSRRGEAGPWLARALAAHQRADAQLDRGRFDAARQSLQAMVEQPPPAGLAAADARVVRQDAFYRLAQIELLSDRPQAALDWCRQGLALGDAGDLFAANLHLDRGRALERLGRDRDAAAAYHRALRINEDLLAAALGDEAPRPEDPTP